MANFKVPKLKALGRSAKSLMFFLGVKDEVSDKLEKIEKQQIGLNARFVLAAQEIGSMTSQLSEFGAESAKSTSRFVQRFGRTRQEMKDLRFDMLQGQDAWKSYFDYKVAEDAMASMIDIGVTFDELKGKFKEVPVLLATINQASGTSVDSLASASTALMRYQGYTKEDVATFSWGVLEIAKNTGISASTIMGSVEDSMKSFGVLFSGVNNIEDRSKILGNISVLRGSLSQLTAQSKEVTDIIAGALAGHTKEISQATLLTGMNMSQLKSTIIEGDITSVLANMQDKINKVQYTSNVNQAEWLATLGLTQEVLGSFNTNYKDVIANTQKYNKSVFETVGAIDKLKDRADEANTVWGRFSNAIYNAANKDLPLLGISIRGVGEGLFSLNLSNWILAIANTSRAVRTLGIAFSALGNTFVGVRIKAILMWAGISGPIGWILLAIAALGLAIWAYWDELGVMFKAIGDGFVKFVDGIIKGVTWLFDYILESFRFIKGLWDGLSSWDWSYFTGKNAEITVEHKFGNTESKKETKNSNLVITGIPPMASGGVVTTPTVALVGEKGPEMVLPLNGDRVVVEDIKLLVAINKLSDKIDMLISSRERNKLLNTVGYAGG